MLFFVTLGVSFMLVTGKALHAGGAQEGSPTHTLSGWVHRLTSNSQRLHTLRHLDI